jgi:integrase
MKPYHMLVFQLLLQTGLRMQEAMHLQWGDINSTDKILTVRSKPQYDFRIKDCEERELPIPDELLERLKQWREKNPKTALVLGTKRDKPNDKWLQMLKRIARTNGLNCGNCQGCKENDECSHYTLHGFRRTYATTLLRNGVDLATVQKLMGHKDLASTMRYLRAVDNKELNQKINGINWSNGVASS